MASLISQKELIEKDRQKRIQEVLKRQTNCIFILYNDWYCGSVGYMLKLMFNKFIRII